MIDLTWIVYEYLFDGSGGGYDVGKRGTGHAQIHPISIFFQALGADIFP